MKKQLLMKTFLVAVSLLVGTSAAWAAEGDNIYSNDFSSNNQTDFATWIGTGKVPSGYTYTIIGRNGAFSIGTGALVHTAPYGKASNNVYDADFGTFNEAITTATAANNYVLSFDITLAITNHIACKSIFEVSDEDKKTVICLYADHTRTNSTTGATSYGYIVGGNNAFATKDATLTTKTNSEGSIGDGTQTVMAANVNGTTGSRTYHVVLDAKTNGMGTLTIKEGETTVVDGVTVNLSQSKGLKYIYLANYNSWETASSQITIDNLSITEGAASTEATATYTVKYVAEIGGVATEIKTAASRTGTVGGSITLDATDKNDIWYNDVKYVYSSDNASTTTVTNDDAAVATVTFVEATEYTYSVTDNLGNTLASGNAYEGTNVDFYVPYYAFKDNKFYTSPSLSSGSLSYGKSTINSISANTTITVTYTEEASTNVVFFSEAENLTGITAFNDGYTQIRMSNGKAGYYAAQTAFVSLPAGKYTITAATRMGTTKFYAGAVGAGVEVYSLTSSGSVVATTSAEFNLIETTDIYTNTGSESAYFDYVIIRKTGEATTVITATIPTSGYGTIASAYALDCANLPNGLKAYKVSELTSTTVTLEEVKEAVAANTGLILKGTAGQTYDIPVAATGTDISATNKLKAAVTAKTLADGSFYILKSGEFCKVEDAADEAARTVPAGKAYLLASDIPSGARSLNFTFDATAIKAVEGEILNGEFYNVAGQRVAQPTKGLYIVNGKKIVVK